MSHLPQYADKFTEWTSRRPYVWSVLIFTAAFLPRLFSPITRPNQWEERAFLFREALLNQDWANTFQQYHPGVTLMWLVAIGIHLFNGQHGPITQEMWLLDAPTPPGLMETGIVYAIAPLAVAISLCILIIYGLLTRLVDQRLAIVAALLLSWDPYFLTYSRVVHVDALLAVFMLVSALSLLTYAYSGQRRYLLGSGAAAGLAFLTKTPSIYLVAYTGLILLVWQGYNHYQTGGIGNGRSVLQVVGKITQDMLIWATVAALLFFTLWPAVWVNASEILPAMWSNLIRHAATPHRNPIYFLGESNVGNPGLLYYLAVIGWKTTLISLPAALLGAGLALWRGWRQQSTQLARTALAVLAFAFFFFAQMSIGEFKQLAYILPVFPALDVLAAVGIVALANYLNQFTSRYKKAWPMVLPVLLLAAQAIFVLPHFPYYGTHYNVLLGGVQTAKNIFHIQDQGEGLDMAADFLNQLPHTQATIAAVADRNGRTFKRVFNGQTTYFDPTIADFRIYDIHNIQRNLYDWDRNWTRLRLSDMTRDPLFTVEFDGITYLWVYGDMPSAPITDGITFIANARFGDHITLQKTIVSSAVVAPGDMLTVVHYWQSDGEAEGSDKVFNHLLDDEGSPVAQRDDFPLNGIRPPYTWTADEQMEDVYHIEIPVDIAPGAYQLGVGFYGPESFQRMPALSTTGDRFTNDTAVIGTITITASSFVADPDN